jgi:glutathione S-transferase
MTLRLYYHPLSSFCMKALVALYENGVAFEGEVVNFMDADQSAAFKQMWPIRKFPVLRDEAADRLVPETSIIIEYIDQKYPGAVRLFPADPDAVREMRLKDRFFDLYVHMQMQKVIVDRLRPEGQNDTFGVAEAREMLRTAYRMIDKAMADRKWAMGDAFTMADCAAAPALFYGEMAEPFGDCRNVGAYLARLKARPSFARVLQEAEPYFKMVPQ